MKKHLLLIFCTLSLVSEAQQPFYQNFVVDDGLPSATVYDIEQDHEGFIWLGTEAGVARFDGLSFKTFSKQEGLADNEVFDIYEDHKGRIWFYPFNKKLSYYYQGKIYNATNDTLLDLPTSGYFKSGIKTPNGGILIGSTGKNLVYYDGKNSCVIETKNRPTNLQSFNKQTLTYSDGKSMHTISLDFTSECPSIVAENTLDSAVVEAPKALVFEGYSPTDSITDKEGNIWISTLGNGVFMRTYEGVFYLNDKTGLSHTNVYSITRNNQKIIAGYKNGSLDIIDKNGIENVHLFEEGYNRVLRLQSGNTMYAATDKALISLTEDFKIKEKQLGAIKCIDDQPDYLYVGTYSGLYKVNKKTGEIDKKLYNKRTLSVCADYDTIWIGTNAGLYFYANDTCLPFPGEQPELRGRIKGLETIRGHLLVGTHGEGLLVNRGDKFIKITQKDGLISNLCNVLYKQNDSTMWMGSNSGLNRIRLSKNPETPPFIDLFSTSNGLISNYINDVMISDNKAYVATDKGISFFNLQAGGKSVNPRVYCKAVAINERDTTILDQYNLSYNQNQLDIEFSAIAFKSGGNTNFKYRLKGHSDKWHFGSKTLVSYEALPPGNYTFEVYALTADNETSIEPATIRFSIDAPFWQTWWFRVIGLILVGFCIIGITRFIIRYNRRKDLEDKNRVLSEKNDEIEKERQRSEELLLNILPEDTARELKANGKVIAKSHESATVFFSDFKGFTELSATVSAEQLVDELDYCFGKFDEIMDTFRIEKIKTIGDAYMSATGLNPHSSDRVEDMVNAALAVISFMKEYTAERTKQNRPFFEVRIGIHLGKVVSGVVGSRKFAYDIWGDTVNTAARMESSGEVNRVNVSQDTYMLIKDKFDCTPRGLISAKGKGELEMYFVNGQKSK